MVRINLLPERRQGGRRPVGTEPSQGWLIAVFGAAVGTAPDGAEAWAGADGLADGGSIGAPPDPFSAAGQIWHLPPPNPWRISNAKNALNSATAPPSSVATTASSP